MADIRKFRMELILTLDMDGIRTPEYWAWGDLLDLKAGEDIYIAECDEIKDIVPCDDCYREDGTHNWEIEH